MDEQQQIKNKFQQLKDRTLADMIRIVEQYMQDKQFLDMRLSQLEEQIKDEQTGKDLKGLSGAIGKLDDKQIDESIGKLDDKQTDESKSKEDSDGQ